MNIFSLKSIGILLSIASISIASYASEKDYRELKLSYPSSPEISKHDCDLVADQLDDLGGGARALIIFKTAEEHNFSSSLLPENITSAKLTKLSANIEWLGGSLVDEAGSKVKKQIEEDINRDIRNSALSGSQSLELKVNSRLLLCDIINSKLEVNIKIGGFYSKEILGPKLISSSKILKLGKAINKYKTKIESMELEYSGSNYKSRDIVAGAVLGVELHKISGLNFGNFDIEDMHYLKEQMFNEYNFLPNSIKRNKANIIENKLRRVQKIDSQFNYNLAYSGEK